MASTPLTRRVHRTLRATLAAMRRTKGQLDQPRWILAARREDDRSDFPASERITTQTLDQFVDTFHLGERRVAVICGRGSFLYQPTTLPAHWAEMLPPAGVAVAAERDRINLWLQLRSIVDPILDLPRIDLNVSEGYDQQSIGFSKGSNETSGRARLWHLAQLSLGEPPGIPNMPSFSDMGFGLDADQLEQLRQRRAALAPHQRSIAQLFGVYAANLTDEWKSFGGIERRALSEMRYRCAAHFAIQHDRDLLDQVAQEVLDLTDEQLAHLLSNAFEPFVGELRSLRNDLAAQQLAPAPEGEEGATADPALAQARPKEETGSVEDLPPGPSEVLQDRAALAQRALRASRRAVALGVLPRDVAQERASRCLIAGAEALTAFEEMIDEQAQARTGRLMREVRVEGVGEVQVPRDPQRYRSLRHRAEVDPELLEISVGVQERMRVHNPTAPGLDLALFRRHCQRELDRRAL